MISKIKSSIKNYLQKISNILCITFSKATSSNLLVLDIDDTLCNNPLHTDKAFEGNLKKIYSDLKFDNNLFDELLNKKPNCDLIILSAREIQYKDITDLWLKKHIRPEIYKFYLCESASQKPFYLEKFLKKYNQITFVDDLSYFVDGKRFFFIEVIDWCKKNLSIEYLGWDFLEKYRDKS